jgi:hypothetical protein
MKILNLENVSKLTLQELFAELERVDKRYFESKETVENTNRRRGRQKNFLVIIKKCFDEWKSPGSELLTPLDSLPKNAIPILQSLVLGEAGVEVDPVFKCLEKDNGIDNLASDIAKDVKEFFSIALKKCEKLRECEKIPSQYCKGYELLLLDSYVRRKGAGSDEEQLVLSCDSDSYANEQLERLNEKRICALYLS